MSRSRRRQRRRLRAWLAVVATLSLWSAALPAASAPIEPTTALSFEPPVDATVVDGYRPPDTPYGAGNRGWEYDTAPGDAVRAAGDGTVAFAGQVGGTYAVTVAHIGGLETTYSYLDAADVEVGTVVRRGERVGTAGERTHFGARLAGEYLDPAALFRPGALRLRARLLASATLSGRPAPRQVERHFAPGPPTVATSAGPGTSNRWEGERQWPLSA